MNHNREQEILNDLETGYDEMAEKFSGTRKHFWSDFSFILDYVKNGDKVLDFGCGNGRLLELFKNLKIDYTGVDVSQKLIEIASENRFGEKIRFSKIADSSRLAFSDNFFNAILSFAVFHHFPKNYSLKVAKELYRTTKPNGTVIISVWNLWQTRFWKNIFSAEAIYKKIFQIGKYRGFGLKDIYIPFKNNHQEKVFDRYHHAYTQKDLENILTKAGFKIEKSSIINKKNIVVVGKKVSVF